MKSIAHSPATTARDERRNPVEFSRAPVAVLGGGISGLALAAWLNRSGVEAVVLEKSDRPGGVIASERVDGFAFERGPNTVLDRCASLDESIEWAGLGADVRRVALKGQARYIWHGGRLHRVPSGPGSLLTTRLFSLGGKLRLLREPWVAPLAGDETIESFAIRRFGREVYERAVAPMVAGVGAGDPSRLSVAASFPALKEMERETGSVLRGFIRRMKAARRSDERRSTSMVSFVGGLESLPLALANRLGDSLHLDFDVRAIRPDGAGFAVEGMQSGEPTRVFAERVVLCAEADVVAGWIADLEPAAAARLAAVDYCPLVQIGLGVERDSLRLPEGFGFLSALGSDLRAIGAIFVSNIFPDRAPEGCATLSVMLGGDLDPEAAEFDDATLIETMRRDLKRALQWNGRFRALYVARWPRAIPQYRVNHAELVRSIDEVETRRPGLRFFGNWRDAAAIGERIERARRLAERIAAEVGRS